MIKFIYDHFGMAIFSEAGLVLFVWVFCTTFIHAARKPKAEVDALARMALDAREDAPVLSHGGELKK